MDVALRHSMNHALHVNARKVSGFVYSALMTSDFGLLYPLIMYAITCKPICESLSKIRYIAFRDVNN